MRTFRIPLLVVAAAAATMLSACADKGTGDNQASGGKPEKSYSIGPDTPTGAEVSPSPSVEPTKGSGGNEGGGGNTNGGGQRWTGPKIEWFRIVEHPKCPSGTDVASDPGRDVTLEWKVTGTDHVTISIDGEGVYGSYQNEYRETFAFPCGDWEPGQKAKHTFLLKAGEGAQEVRKTLTPTATVHEITVVSTAPPAASGAE